MDLMGHHMKTSFDYFQIQKLMSQTIRVEKVNKKNEAIFLALLFPSWVTTLKLFRKVHILQFCADFSKKPKSIQTIYILHLKVLITHFQKMIWFIGVWAIVYEILAIKVSKKMLTQPKLKKKLTSKLNISQIVIHKNYNKQLLFSESAKQDLLHTYM